MFSVTTNISNKKTLTQNPPDCCFRHR